MDRTGHTETSGAHLYPTILARVQALFLDVWAVIGIQLYILSVLFPEYDGQYVLAKIGVFFSLFMVYETLMNMTGGTIGYRTLGLKIRSCHDPEQKIGLRSALKRTVLKLAIGWISFLSLSLDPFRRAIHDKIAGTLVLRAD